MYARHELRKAKKEILRKDSDNCEAISECTEYIPNRLIVNQRLHNIALIRLRKFQVYNIKFLYYILLNRKGYSNRTVK